MTDLRPAVIYGATGSTSRLVAEYLREYSIPFVAAGRNKARLQEVMDKVPGGLALARVLQVHGIAATVHEAEPAPDARRQGGLLDLHPDSGQAALKAACLFEEFRKRVLPGREAYRITDQAGKLLLDLPDTGTGERPEIPCGALRQLLLDSLPAGTVRWGHKVTPVQAVADGRHRVDFADGTSMVVDLLIGADGVWSRVRPLLSQSRPQYLGVLSVETFLFDADTRHPASRIPAELRAARRPRVPSSME